MELTNEQMQRSISALYDEIGLVQKNAHDANRAMTFEEADVVRRGLERINELSDALKPGEPTRQPIKPDPGDMGPGYDDRIRQMRSSGFGRDIPVGIVPRTDGKVDFRSLFGSFGNIKDNGGFRSLQEYIQVANSGRYDPRFENIRTLVEGTPKSGGFLVPIEYTAEIHDVAIENEIILPRCQVYPMKSNAKKIPAAVIGNHSENLFGGMIAYFTKEGGDLTERNPEYREMELVAKKLTQLFKYSSEWLEDAVSGEAWLRTAAGKALGWFRDYHFINGSGSGQPQGILNSPCLKVVSAETGQTADTIIYDNVINMLMALAPTSFGPAIWLAHQTTLAQLMSLSLPVGTGGNAIAALTENNGQYRLMGKSLFFTEKVNTLGDQGDLILCDLTQYAVGVRADLRYETSIGPAFTTDEIYARLISRFDGQGLWNEKLTLKDGVTEVSPFVTLAAR